MLERDIEGMVAKYAGSKGCMSLHLNVLGRIGWPDRIFLYYGARVVFIEFKLPGEKPRKIQEFIHGKLRQFGFTVALVDSVALGERVINDFTSDSPFI